LGRFKVGLPRSGREERAPEVEVHLILDSYGTRKRKHGMKRDDERDFTRIAENIGEK
jgi:hypothetical protein